MIHQGIDIYDIQALVDDELGHEEQKRVRSHLEMNPLAREYYESLLRQRRMIRHWWNQQSVSH